MRKKLLKILIIGISFLFVMGAPLNIFAEEKAVDSNDRFIGVVLYDFGNQKIQFNVYENTESNLNKFRTGYCNSTLQ